MEEIRQAVILAGGQGTRLRPLTFTTPKPLIEVAGKPFVQHLIEHLRDEGVEEVVLLTSYLHEKFPLAFGDGSKLGVRMRYAVSDLDDESGTRLKKAEALLDDSFLLLYGDNFWPVPVREIAAAHRTHAPLVTMVAYANARGDSEYGFENNLTVQGGFVSHYGARGTGENAIDVGTFFVEKRALARMPEGNPIFQRDLINELIPKREVRAFMSNTPYCFITSPDLILSAEEYIKKNKK